MNKDEFFDRLDKAKAAFAKRNYAPAGLRIDYHEEHSKNSHWLIWIVGPGSVDPCLVLAADIWPIGKKYKSTKRLYTDLLKFNRWFEEWKNENPR